jgi:hypothetical protein
MARRGTTNRENETMGPLGTDMTVREPEGTHEHRCEHCCWPFRTQVGSRCPRCGLVVAQINYGIHHTVTDTVQGLSYLEPGAFGPNTDALNSTVVNTRLHNADKAR